MRNDSSEKMKELYMEHMKLHLPRPFDKEIISRLINTQIGMWIVEATVAFAVNVQAEVLSRCSHCQERGTDARCQCWNDE